MNTKSKFALLAAILAVSMASPAFAQSRNDGQTTAAKLDEVVFHQTVPSKVQTAPVLIDYSDNPNAAGGGSYGYNNESHHDFF